MFKRKGRTTVVVVAALVPACAAGWLVWDAAIGPDSPGRNGDLSGKRPGASRPNPSAAPSASVRPPSASVRPPSASVRPPSAAARPLAGKVVVLDPGHNTRNNRHTAEINRKVDIGTARKECDTTGTATNAGYAEAAFTLDVSRRARALLEARGATVKLTHDGGRAYGPCIDERARIGNTAKADAVVSVHGDGSAAGNRGFHVVLPAPVHRGIADTRGISGPSKLLGTALKRHFAAETGTRPSNYIGGGTGLDVRRDLGGLNLSTVPKVLLECGNMRDPKDAALMTDAAWRQRAAEGVADGITAFLQDRE